MTATYKLKGRGGDLKRAQRRRELTKLIYQSFSELDEFRKEIYQSKTWQLDGNTLVNEIVKLAARHELLKPRSNNQNSVQKWKVTNHSARTYLTGSWLEELMALALIDAQCDAVRFSQEIEWTAAVDGSLHMNEIDAMALAGNKSVFVSCKAMANATLDDRKGEKRLFTALQELSYWNMHFAKGDAICFFMTTVDFYDETKKTFRSPKLVERANAMNIHVIPADYTSYDAILMRIKEILD